ncbi:hypothetical protein BOTBODRAFT_36013 [Botryobasidium botryosum FD-172 SS1]|uniref:SnoaL-like domain-containing protein n=1 Tax=Botryobasidium botryosum (strain FD-172 SS1) TaxID=930990 RepID=A0A067M552_BOTB1|nr:hypothetical protein BOTBODRAFT_36013 [Botryobasidium botryosum FD-172 SS1]
MPLSPSIPVATDASTEISCEQRYFGQTIAIFISTGGNCGVHVGYKGQNMRLPRLFSPIAAVICTSNMVVIDNPSPQLRAVLGWIDGHDHCDCDAAHAYCTDDFIHELLPTRVGYRFTKEQLKQHHESIFAGVFTGFKTEILDIMERPGHIFVHARSVAKPLRVGVVEPSRVTHEFNGAFTMVGDKIQSVKVFTDTAFASEYLAELQR